MAESPQHRRITKHLASMMRANDVEVPYSTETGLPDPPAVGRHEPDVIGFRGAVQYNGEAECGPDLFAPHTLEQLRDFATHALPGYRPVLVLCVPVGFEQDAWEAVRRAGALFPETMVLTAPPLRVRRRAPARPAARVPLQRGRQRPVAPGQLMQRGREQPVPPTALAAILRSRAGR